MRYVRCIHNESNEASLEVGFIYRALPTTEFEKETGMLRVIDNEGEDYLYPARWFELVTEEDMRAELSESLTVHLNGVAKVTIRDMANARGVTMSALVRDWIDERLDLAEFADTI